MTIERMSPDDEDGNAKWLITCDERGCKAAYDAINADFKGAVNLAKSEGWTLRKVYSTWQHRCPKH